MPEFEIQDPRTGRTLTIDANRAPTQEEALALFAQEPEMSLGTELSNAARRGVRALQQDALSQARATYGREPGLQSRQRLVPAFQDLRYTDAVTDALARANERRMVGLPPNEEALQAEALSQRGPMSRPIQGDVQRQALEETIAETAAEKAAIPMGPDVREAYQGSLVDALIRSPVRVPLAVTAESAPRMALPIGLAIATRGAGGGIPAGVGAGTFATEAAAGLSGEVEARGIDMTDPQAVRRLYNEPGFIQSGYDRGVARAIPISAVALGSMAGAGSLVSRASTPFQKGAALAAEVVAQSLADMGGEAVAQITSTGGIESGRDIALEGLGSLAPSVAETAVGVAARPAAPMASAAPAEVETVAETAPTPALAAPAPEASSPEAPAQAAPVTEPEATPVQEPEPSPQEPAPAAERPARTGPVFNRDLRSFSRSNLGRYEYLREAPRGKAETQRAEYARELADFHGDDYDAAIREVESIQPSSFQAVARAELTARIADKLRDPQAPDYYRLSSLLRRLAPRGQNQATETAQALQAQSQIRRRLQPFAPVLAWMDLLRARTKKEIDTTLGEGFVEGARQDLDEASNEASEAVPQNLETEDPIVPEAIDAVPFEPPAELGDQIMQQFPQASFRERLTKQGVRKLAGEFTDLIGLTQKQQPGNLQQFDAVVRRELGRKIKDAFEAAGFAIKKEKPSRDVAQEMAAFIGEDPLKSDKLALVDKLVRRKIARADSPHMEALWDFVVGSASENAPSNSTLRGAVATSLKDLGVDLGKFLDQGYTQEQRARVIDDVVNKVVAKTIPEQTSGMDTGPLRQAVGAAFDRLAAERVRILEAGQVYARAKEAMKLTAEPEKTAASILDQYAKTQSDTPMWPSKKTPAIRKIFADYLKWNETPDSFRAKMKEAGLGDGLTERLLAVANTEQTARRAADRIRASEKFQQWLQSDTKTAAAIRKAADRLDISWRELFQQLPEIQADRKLAIMDRAMQSPQFAELTESERKQAVDALNAAWERQREAAFRSQFAKRVSLPRVDAQKSKLETALPEVFRLANQGLLDNDAFRDAFAKSMGLESIEGANTAKLVDLGRRAANAPEGVVRNKILREAKDLLESGQPVNVWDLVQSAYYSSILSSLRTATTIFTGSAAFGAVNTLMAAIDTAVAFRRPDIALRMVGDFFRAIPYGVSNFVDLVRTGDYTRLPEFGREITENLEGRFRANEFEKLLRSDDWRKRLAGTPAYVQRVLTGLDQFFSSGVREAGLYYTALSRNDMESVGALLEKADKASTKRAREQAEAELRAAGVEPKKQDIRARSREILEQEVAGDIREGAVELGRTANLNRKPPGFGGAMYDVLSQIPFLIRVPAGMVFLRAAINLMQNGADWMPGSGLLNYARSSPKIREALKSTSLPDRAIEMLAPELAPEQRRMIATKQIAGLALLMGVANRFLFQDHDEDEWEITGSFRGLPYNRIRALTDAGIRPNSFWKRDPETGKIRSVTYTESPMAALLATVGNYRDQQIYNGAAWDEIGLEKRLLNAWMMGFGYVTELPMLSQASSLLGMSAFERAQDPSETLDKMGQKTQKAAGALAGGAIPFSGLMKDVDVATDPSVYRPDMQNPGYGLFLRNIPFARRLSADRPALDIFGEPIKDTRAPLSRILRDQQNQPEMNLLADKMSEGVFPMIPGRTTELVDAMGNKRQMTEDEWHRYMQAYGAVFKRVVATHADTIRARPSADKLRATIMERIGSKADSLNPQQREKLNAEIESFINKESAEGWFSRAHLEITRALREGGIEGLDFIRDAAVTQPR